MYNFKPTGCQWVFKTERDSRGNGEHIKARLVAVGFLNAKELILVIHFHQFLEKIHFNYYGTSCTFWLELHQMDGKTAFLNGQLFEEVYMFKLESFEIKEQRTYGM